MKPQLPSCLLFLLSSSSLTTTASASSVLVSPCLCGEDCSTPPTNLTIPADGDGHAQCVDTPFPILSWTQDGVSVCVGYAEPGCQGDGAGLYGCRAPDCCFDGPRLNMPPGTAWLSIICV
ncbi:hypothetical protein F4778DRAFT_786887 [Xylariomycetidae sp. FL2044]|nr:hypothetical protein F4778DRAFT_786887 [Xylariomycetidae sp. FL2044]